MTEPTTDSPRSTKSFRPLAWRLFLFAAGGFALLLVVFAALIVPDQVRPVAEPEIALDFYGISLGAKDAAQDGETSASLSGFLTEGGTDRAMSRPSGGAESRAASRPMSRPMSLEEIQKMVRPVLDPSQMPEELRADAEEWNRAMDGLTSELLAVVRASETMTYHNASRAFGDIYNRWANVRSPYSEPFYNHKEYWEDAPDRNRNGKENADWTHARLRIQDADDAWRETYYKAYLGVALKKEEWLEAASLCMHLSGPIPDKYSPLWQVEVHCWRQCGPNGRAMLAYRSVQPVVFPLRRAFRPLDALFRHVPEPLLAEE